MQLKSVSFNVYHEGDYYSFRFELSEKTYCTIVPYLSERYGDRNYRQFRLVGQPWVYDLFVFKLELYSRIYYLVFKEFFWSEYSEQEFEIEIEDVKIKIRADLKERNWFYVFNREEFDKFLEAVENYDK